MKYASLSLLILLSACDPTPPPQPETQHTPNPIFDTQIQALEKAKAVEGQMNEAAEAQRKQVEALEQ